MDVREAIESRRAWRSLAPVEIDRDTIEDLARCASLAASCFNKQPWRFDFVTGGAKLDLIRGTRCTGAEWVVEMMTFTP